MTEPRKSSGSRPPTGDPALGRNLRAARRERKLTLAKLAELTSVTKSQLSQIEGGLVMPSVDLLKRVAKALGCGADAILFGRGREFKAPAQAVSGLERRIASLPDAMREFVIQSLERAEYAAKHVPGEFLRGPTSENWPAFASYLEAMSEHYANGKGDKNR